MKKFLKYCFLIGVALLLIVGVGITLLFQLFKCPEPDTSPGLIRAADATSLGNFHGSKLLFSKASPYAQWVPFWTTDHRILFVDTPSPTKEPQKAVFYDPQALQFGPEEPVRNIQVGNNALIVNGNTLLNSLYSPIVGPSQVDFCKPYRALIEPQLSSSSFTCWPLPSGKLWVKLSPSQESYLFNTRTHELKMIPGSQGDYRPGAKDAYVLSNDQILFLGTSLFIPPEPKGTRFNKVRLYDPATNRIIDLPDLEKELRSVAFAKTRHKVLIIGAMGDNQSTLLYNPLSKTFKPGPRLNKISGVDVAVFPLDNGDVLVIGDDSEPIHLTKRWVERYDHKQNRFVLVGGSRLAKPERDYERVFMLDPSHFLIIGGSQIGCSWEWEGVYSIELFRP